MPFQPFDFGTAALNDGEKARTAFPKIQSMFGELYDAKTSFEATQASFDALMAGASVDFDTLAEIAAGLAGKQDADADLTDLALSFTQNGTGAATRTWRSKAQDIVSVADFGAVGDWNGTTGTDNSTAFNNAFAVAAVVYLPDGDYYVSQASTARLIEKATTFGPGRMYGPWFGGDQEFGKTIKAGRASTSVGNNLVGGLVLGGDAATSGPLSEGVRLWASTPMWMQFQPTMGGLPTQVQVYHKCPTGRAVGTVASDIIEATTGTFSAFLDWSEDDIRAIQEDDEIGWGDELYLVDEYIDSTHIRLKNTDGSPWAATDTTTRTFRHAYQYSYGRCNVSGTTVTRTEGQDFNIGAFAAGQSWVWLDGTRYAVSSEDSFNQLTLGSSAGTLTDVEFVQKSLDTARYITLLRLQTLGGGAEENTAMYMDTRGRFILDGSGTAGVQKPKFVYRADASYDDSNETEHVFFERDGRVGFNGAPPANYAGAVSIYHFASDTQTVGGTEEAQHMLMRAQFDGGLRLTEFYHTNNFYGLHIQSEDNSGSPVQMHLSPKGGGVIIGSGTANMTAFGYTLGVNGNIGPTTNRNRDVGSAGFGYANVYSANFRPGSTGDQIWTTRSGTPEGALSAPVGSLCTRTDGGASTTLYIKESGSGNTGWAAIQGADADLISWAAITRASGFDTFVATPSSANLAALLTDETGTGAAVFGTSPSFTTSILPVSNDGAAIGSTSNQWSDIFLADGGVQNWANGAATVSAADSSGTITYAADPANTRSASAHLFAVDGTTRLVVDATRLRPNANDGLQLGSTTQSWSDLFLAAGGVLNWNNGAATLTHDATADALAVGAAWLIQAPPSTTPPTLGTNGQFTMTLTSNTNMRISARGSDGTTRVADITLA